jgi:hypothetical protein
MRLTATTQSKALNRLWKVKSMDIINFIANDIPEAKISGEIDRTARNTNE